MTAVTLVLALAKCVAVAVAVAIAVAANLPIVNRYLTRLAQQITRHVILNVLNANANALNADRTAMQLWKLMN